MTAISSWTHLRSRLAARYKKTAELEAEVRSVLLRRGQSDHEVLRALEEIQLGEPAFFMTAASWAPELYRRNRVVFGPFIQNRLSQSGFDGRRIRELTWKSVSDSFEPWLASAAADDDDPVLFCRLFFWKHARIKAEELVSQHILPELREAASESKKQHVLRKYGRYFFLTEELAAKIYESAPRSGRRFILDRLPPASLLRKRNQKPWRDLMQTALQKGDEDFRLDLYKRQIPLNEWQHDLLELAESDMSDDDLVTALNRRHPISFGESFGPAFVALLKKRGRGALPYVYRHLHELRRFFGRGSNDYKTMLAFAAEAGWVDLWAAVVRVCGGPKEFSQALESILLDPALDDEQSARRLALLSGTSRELNFGGFGLARLHRLDDQQAVGLYEAYPHLVRGPFKANLMLPFHGSGYPKLLSAAVEREDHDLIDHLASRMVTRTHPNASELSDFVVIYQALENDDHLFAERAASVLSRVPAYAIFSYETLITKNRLARLLYERSASRLANSPAAVRDLLESPEIHAQILGMKAVSTDVGRQNNLPDDNLDLLLPMLLRPLHRRTRTLAFTALEHAAGDAGVAEHIVNQAKQALDLPDRKYPKDELIALIGRLLARQPNLRNPTEAIKVYRRGAA